MAKKEYNRLLNFAEEVALKTLYLQRYKIEKLLIDYIAKNKSGMIISCVPMVNPIMLKVSKKFVIPLLVITTDIDISAFSYGFKRNTAQGATTLCQTFSKFEGRRNRKDCRAE